MAFHERLMVTDIGLQKSHSRPETTHPGRERVRPMPGRSVLKIEYAISFFFFLEEGEWARSARVPLLGSFGPLSIGCASARLRAMSVAGRRTTFDAEEGAQRDDIPVREGHLKSWTGRLLCRRENVWCVGVAQVRVG